MEEKHGEQNGSTEKRKRSADLHIVFELRKERERVIPYHSVQDNDSPSGKLAKAIACACTYIFKIIQDFIFNLSFVAAGL